MNTNETAPVKPAPVYKDRRMALKVFGIAEILLGALVGLMVPFMILGMALAARTEPEAVNVRIIAPSVALYAGAAVALIWLGIGSIKARRWARAITLVVGWFWLVVGVTSLIVTAVVMPQVLQDSANGAPGVGREAQVVAMVVSFGILFVGFVLIPGILVAFYQSPHVKATCEVLNPRPCWTDACPLPVLGLSLVLWAGASMMLLMPLTGMCVLPVFGGFVGGWPAGAAFLLLGMVWAVAGWAVYRMRVAGWWVGVACVVVFGVSAAVTFARVDLLEMYRLMGYTETQLDMIRRSAFLRGTTMVFMSLAGAVPWLLYLLWVRRYFRPSETPPVVDTPPPPNASEASSN